MLSSRFGLRSQLLTAWVLALLAIATLLLLMLAGQQAITVGGPLDGELQRDRALLARGRVMDRQPRVLARNGKPGVTRGRKATGLALIAS